MRRRAEGEGPELDPEQTNSSEEVAGSSPALPSQTLLRMRAVWKDTLDVRSWESVAG